MREFLCGAVARIDMRSARLVFWDLGGQEDLQSLWDKVPPPLSLSLSWPQWMMSLLQYYSECQGVIYVIDSCDPENLAISAQTFSESPNKQTNKFTINSFKWTIAILYIACNI